MNDQTGMAASWNGRLHPAANWSAPDHRPERTGANPGETAFDPSNGQLGLANVGADTPALLPPGHESSYRISFNVPVGRNESFNLQAGIRKNALNVPGSNDSTLRAAWSMKF